jgi:hypothetical protein
VVNARPCPHQFTTDWSAVKKLVAGAPEIGEAEAENPAQCCRSEAAASMQLITTDGDRGS